MAVDSGHHLYTQFSVGRECRRPSLNTPGWLPATATVPASMTPSCPSHEPEVNTSAC